MSKPFAAFLLATPSSHANSPRAGLYLCATTRAVDRGEGGLLGLPGGKIDPGESPADAARREALEEGWALPTRAVLTEAHRAQVDGHTVVWLRSDTPAVKRVNFKEKGRIMPIVLTINEVAYSGYGNEWLLDEKGMWG